MNRQDHYDGEMNPVREIAGWLLLFVCFLFVLTGCSGKGEVVKEHNIDSQSTVSRDQFIQPAAPPANFKHQVAQVNGVIIHFVVGGEGEPLLLLHGFGQNWYMWNRLLPDLSRKFTVIAPDLRGIGESTGADSGFDKKTMASDMHELIRKLGYSKVKLAGHDLGLMVAYAYAAQWPDEVKRVAFLDALLPGIEPVWTTAKTQNWWFGFFARPASGDLVSGRERLFLTDFWPVVGHVQEPFTKEESEEFVRAYSQPGAIKSSFRMFAAFNQDALDNQAFSKVKLSMPVLTIGGEYSAASYLEDHFKLVAVNVKGVKVPGAGHWIVQENTDVVRKAMLEWFAQN